MTNKLNWEREDQFYDFRDISNVTAKIGKEKNKSVLNYKLGILLTMALLKNGVNINASMMTVKVYKKIKKNIKT